MNSLAMLPNTVVGKPHTPYSRSQSPNVGPSWTRLAWRVVTLLAASQGRCENTNMYKVVLLKCEKDAHFIYLFLPIFSFFVKTFLLLSK